MHTHRGGSSGGYRKLAEMVRIWHGEPRYQVPVPGTRRFVMLDRRRLTAVYGGQAVMTSTLIVDKMCSLRSADWKSLFTMYVRALPRQQARTANGVSLNSSQRKQNVHLSDIVIANITDRLHCFVYLRIYNVFSCCVQCSVVTRPTFHGDHAQAPRSHRRSPAHSPTTSSSSTQPGSCCLARPPDVRHRRSRGSGLTAVSRSLPYLVSWNSSATDRSGSGRSRTSSTARRSTQPPGFAAWRPTTSAPSSASWSESELVSLLLSQKR